MPITALDEDVGLESCDESQRVGFGKLHDVIDAGQCRQYFTALGVWNDGPICSFFERSDGGVGIDADDQDVAKIPGGLQIARVADMQEIKAAVREHDGLALPPMFVKLRTQLFN